MSSVRFSRDQRARGYTLVYCRRHVVEPFELTPEERARYFEDVLAVAQALQRIYRPVKLNYEILGNIVPHLHCHIIPRYRDDAAPNWLPWPIFDQPKATLSPDEYRAAVERLRAEIPVLS